MKKDKIIILGFILSLALGLFFRFYHLGNQSYWMDEGYTINAVISGTANGFSNGSSMLDSGEKYFCPMYCYPSAQIAQIIGQNAWSYRVLAALFGGLFILLSYYLTKTIFKNQKAALLSAFFVAFSYWQIAWSQQARWYTMLEVFFWLALLLFYLFLTAKNNKQKIINLVLSLVFTVLAITTHRLAYLLPLIFFIFLLTLKSGQLFKNKKIIFYHLSFIITFLAFIEYVLGFHFITSAIGNINFHYNLPYYLNFYLRNYWPFIIIIIYGYFSAPRIIPAKTGIQSLDNTLLKQKITLLLIPFLVYLFFLSFFTDIIHYRYLFHTTVAFYIISAVCVIPTKEGIQSFGTKRYIPAFAGITLIVIFFLTGQGVLYPKNFYTLESDDPSKLNRPYYAYTPQPDFNKAYGAIKNNLQSEEIIISSHPHFNKIFLDQAGYWIKYDYLGFGKNFTQPLLVKEHYVNAEVINNLEELKKITAAKHGYIVFDYQSADGRIDPQVINYIQTNLQLLFYNKINTYSQIWVYKF